MKISGGVSSFSPQDDKRPTPDKLRSTPIYRAWRERNEDDVKYYEEAVKVFNSQFRAALKLLRTMDDSARQKAVHCAR